MLSVSDKKSQEIIIRAIDSVITEVLSDEFEDAFVRFGNELAKYGYDIVKRSDENAED